jgi:3-deoxy-D-manno-octulosonate 8-phosphate phosphatase (KDO 8-P phosphatase)
MLRESGVRLAIITGRKAPCVEWRMKNLRIDLLLQGVDNKLAALKGLLDELGLTPEEAGFMGDDVIDLQVMDLCGFSAAPANAHPLAMKYARLVTERSGGFGAAREVCEFILEAQGKLEEALALYLPTAHPAAAK